MYSHTFFVTSVRGNDVGPQIAAKASLRLFFAKMPPSALSPRTATRLHAHRNRHASP